MHALIAVLPVLAGALLAAPPYAAAQPASGTTAAGVFYEASGSGEPLVLVHAFSVDRRMWAPQVEAFEARYRVIRFDLRGHGMSVAPLEPYQGYEDLRAVLDALKVERAAVVGLSAGSELATNFAIAYPDRVTKLVLAAPGLGGVANPPLPWAAPVFQAAAAGEPERAARLWAETPIMALRLRPGAASVRSLVMDNARLWTYKRTERPMTPPAVERLQAITRPALVVVGDKDLPHIIQIAQTLVDKMPDARLATIAGAGHMVNLDAPERFNELVAEFLAAPADTPARIGRVAWLQGCWEAAMGERIVEEQWMAPRGTSMVGVSRTVRGDRLVEYELIVIREDGDRLVYVAHPSGQPSATFPARMVNDSMVLFENPEHDFPQRIGYERTRDGLLAWIEGTQNGQRRRVEFPYRRATCAGG